MGEVRASVSTSIGYLEAPQAFRERKTWKKLAVRALAALGHESRLRVFRLLARADETGVAAGILAQELELPAATLSFHLKEMRNAELVVDRRQGRSIYYAVNTPMMKSIVKFLLEDCCGCEPETRDGRDPEPTRKPKRGRAV